MRGNWQKMFLTVHATLGAAIGYYSGNIWLSFIAGLVSHLVLDAIPHGDEILIEKKSFFTFPDIKKIIKIASLDGFIMMIWLLFLYRQNLLPLTLPILAGIFGSILPDGLSGIYLLTNNSLLKKITLAHWSLHHFIKIHVSLFFGFIIQLSLVLLFLSIIIYHF